MIKLQAVIFDYGNVLCEPQRVSDLVAMSTAAEIAMSSFERAYWEFRDGYDKGKFDARSYWNAIGHESGKTLTEDQITKLIELDNLSWTRPNPSVAQWAKELFARGIKTAILSNMPLELRKYIASNCSWLPKFNEQVYSCDVGSIKPEAEIYNHCLSALKIKPQEALFLDDREPNVTAAIKLGINAIVFNDLENASREISAKYELPTALYAIGMQ